MAQEGHKGLHVLSGEPNSLRVVFPPTDIHSPIREHIESVLVAFHSFAHPFVLLRRVNPSILSGVSPGPAQSR